MDNIKELITDIFQVSSTQSKDSNEFEVDADAISSAKSFEDRVEEMKEKVTKEDVKIVSLEHNKKDNNMDNETLIKELIDENVSDNTDDIFGDFDKLEVEEKPEEKKKEEVDEKETEKETEEESPVEVESVPKKADKSESEVVDDVKIIGGKIEWLLKSPGDRYNKFYAEKKDMIPQILFDGQVPYIQWMNELKNSSVDTGLEIYDDESMRAKMEQIRKVRDRVQEIALQCNAQYFLWERSIEMFHGLLARTEYEKPVIRQEGLIYEHMRDMELYFARLKSIHKSVDQILKTLELAYEAVSRQVTISLQNRESPDRYAKKTADTPRQLNNDSDFDQLPMGAESKKKPKTTGIADWNDI